jgi:hypothetical protein
MSSNCALLRAIGDLSIGDLNAIRRGTLNDTAVVAVRATMWAPIIATLSRAYSIALRNMFRCD